MENSIVSKAQKQLKKQQKKRMWRRIVSVLGSIVVFCTTYALILPAITMSDDTYCGIEEHTHSESCYTQTLICGHLENDTDQTYAVMEHQDENEEHIHDVNCYIEEEVYICDQIEDEEHLHEESCWETKQHLICGIDISFETVPETETVLHVHSEACYYSELTCELQEHVHELICFSNPEADIETADDWEATLPTFLTGDLRKDVIAIAESQLGYTESELNYIVTEDEPIKGYTRYGAWYGDPYGHWCAMFVSFCLDYANADIPLGSACSRWIQALKAEPYELYREKEDYVPQSGDIVFFDWEVNNDPDHVGLVAEIIPAADNEPAKIRTIEGNSGLGDNVMYMTYDLDSPMIFGYASIIPEATDESNHLRYEDDALTAVLHFPDTYEIPQNAVLNIQKMDEEQNTDDFEAMSQAVSDTIITEDDKILNSLYIYRIQVTAEGEIVEVPEDVETLLEVTYKEDLYSEEEINLAAELVAVGIEPVMQTFSIRGEAASYEVTEPSATFANVSEGVTGFTIQSQGVLQNIAIATEAEVKTGNFWKRVNDISELALGDT